MAHLENKLYTSRRCFHSIAIVQINMVIMQVLFYLSNEQKFKSLMILSIGYCLDKQVVGPCFKEYKLLQIFLHCNLTVLVKIKTHIPFAM